MVVDKAREAVKKHIKKADIAGLRQKMLKEFDSMGIYQTQLETYLGHVFDTTTPEEITQLQGILSSIRGGRSRPGGVFRYGSQGERRETEGKRET